MSNVKDFLAKVNQYKGLASPNRVRTDISGPTILGAGGILRDLSAFCPISALPGVHLDNETVRHAGIGKTEQRPVDIQYNSIGMQFFCDNEGKVLEYFHKWLDLVVDSKDGSSNMDLFSFPDDYIGTVEIEAHNIMGTSVKKYTLLRAHPVSIEDVITAWDMTDTLLMLPVTFTYYNWESTSSRPSPGTTTFQG